MELRQCHWEAPGVSPLFPWNTSSICFNWPVLLKGEWWIWLQNNKTNKQKNQPKIKKNQKQKPNPNEANPGKEMETLRVVCCDSEAGRDQGGSTGTLIELPETQDATDPHKVQLKLCLEWKADLENYQFYARTMNFGPFQEPEVSSQLKKCLISEQFLW